MPAPPMHEVRDARNAQTPPEYPTESYVDPLTGQRLRRQYFGSCTGGRLLVGGIARSTGTDLF